MEKEPVDPHTENMFTFNVSIENESDMFLMGIHTGKKDG
jgi:hypothetical protein